MTGQVPTMTSPETWLLSYGNEKSTYTKEKENRLLKGLNSWINRVSGSSLPEKIIFSISTILPEVSDTQSSRRQMLSHYLVSVREAGDISAHTASVAWKVWNLLSHSMDNSLPVPDAAPGPEGQLLYVWEKKEHYFEAEIFPNDIIEFFYWNRETNEAWEKDCNAGEPIFRDIEFWLKFFI